MDYNKEIFIKRSTQNSQKILVRFETNGGAIFHVNIPNITKIFRKRRTLTQY